MELNVDDRRLAAEPVVKELIQFLRGNEETLGLNKARLYYDFPILKDSDDKIVVAQLLVLSPNHGLALFGTTSVAHNSDTDEKIELLDAEIENVFSLIFSRLMRTKALRKNKTELRVPTITAIFSPNLASYSPTLTDTMLLTSVRAVASFFNSNKKEISEVDFQEIVSTLEGAKGIARAKIRSTTPDKPNSKGALATKIEEEIASFDRNQRQGAMPIVDGCERIRGLAGSGKTVVLAMKAALTHLKNPDSIIVYTFYTKSLYQHIKRLITRFYRQFDDKDPDWNRLRILHGWGGYRDKGVYSEACYTFGIDPVTFTTAKANKPKDPFDWACKELIKSAEIRATYDYILIDEGQDFPSSFVHLCMLMTKNSRVVLAYDELQTIFRPTVPDFRTLIPKNKDGIPVTELKEDVILHKCYRNPREILVCAHALGFGIYGEVVQMLPTKEDWEALGYRVERGDFIPTHPMEIQRPEENSLLAISQNQRKEEIVSAYVFRTLLEEVDDTVESIKREIDEGLRADDILVIVVDDHNAKSYLETISNKLLANGIATNNMHIDQYGIRDFFIEGEITLSTVHKAKGNEAFLVYVLGVDALFSSYAGPKERNTLFTAMTRAKGWVRVSGVGPSATKCKDEIVKALDNFPYLKFDYPDEQTLKLIKSGVEKRAIEKQQAEEKIEEALGFLTPEQIESYLLHRKIKKV